MKLKVITFCLLYLVCFISLNTSAQLITPRQENIIKAKIDNEYQATLNKNIDEEQALYLGLLIFTPDIIQNKVYQDPNIKQHIYSYILRQLSLRATTQADELDAILAKEAQQFPHFASINIPWLAMLTSMQSTSTPSFVCQQQDEICRYFTQNDENFSQIELYSLKHNHDKIPHIIEIICKLQHNCHSAERKALTQQLMREINQLDEDQAEEQLKEFMKKFKIEYNYSP